MKKVLYWAFEGNEGTGKTSLSKRFSEKCGATWTYEPNGETEELLYLRKLALTKNERIDGHIRENLFISNRGIHHKNCVIPLLNNMNTVVTDRCFLSGLVYAKLQSLTFDQFFKLSELSNLFTYPDIIIYCTTEQRKIVKNEDDIYDNASEETLNKIDTIYEEALEYIKDKKYTKNIKIIKFEIDFSVSKKENLDKLFDKIKGEKINEV